MLRCAGFAFVCFFKVLGMCVGLEDLGDREKLLFFMELIITAYGPSVLLFGYVLCSLCIWAEFKGKKKKKGLFYY